MENLGEKIVKLRKERNMSQEQFAELMGVSRQTVSKWESGAVLPSLDNIRILVNEFGVSADYFLSDGDETAVSVVDEVAAAKDTSVKKHFGLIITSVILAAAFVIFTIITVIAGFIVFPINTEGVTVGTDDINIYHFIIFLVVDLIIFSIDVFLWVYIKKHRK